MAANMACQEYDINQINTIGQTMREISSATRPSPSPLLSIHMAAGDVRDALIAARDLMERLVGPSSGQIKSDNAEPVVKPPLFDLLGDAGRSISVSAREIAACLSAINAKLP